MPASVLSRTVLVGTCAVAALLLLVALSSPRLAAGGGQGEDLRRRMDALEAGQKEILKQLQEMKTLLQQSRPPTPAQQPPPPPALPSQPVSLAGAASRGSASAKLTIVEFSDFQCPFCGRYARETFEQINKEYVATGKVRYLFRQYPIEKLHPNAFKAAIAAECAQQQGRFWEMHDRLFANQQALSDVELLNSAKAVGMNSTAFQTCVTQPGVTGKIRLDLDEGARAGITGTPTFFMGVVQKDGKLKVLRKVPGAAPFATFKSAIDTLLASPELK
jgi:protein-disulfide isomerase